MRDLTHVGEKALGLLVILLFFFFIYIKMKGGKLKNSIMDLFKGDFNG